LDGFTDIFRDGLERSGVERGLAGELAETRKSDRELPAEEEVRAQLAGGHALADAVERAGGFAADLDPEIPEKTPHGKDAAGVSDLGEDVKRGARWQGPSGNPHQRLDCPRAAEPFRDQNTFGRVALGSNATE
jgi:hypothetical protein